MENNTSTSNRFSSDRKKKPYSIDNQIGMGKMPPQALDLEESVLGSIILEKDALGLVSDFVKPQTFYNEKHSIIYKAILALFSNSEPIDIRTVTNQLRKSGELEMVGGAYFIAELTTKIASAANIEFHARILMEYAIKRELITVATTIQKDAYEDTSDVFESLDHAEKMLFEVSENNIRKNYDNIKNVMVQALAEIEERRKKKDGLTGVPSGFTLLDRLTSGWQKSDLVIIAARPAMGKTAFILSTVRNAAVDHGKGCAIFSLEMSNIQLVNRLISAEAELSSEKIKKGTLAEHEWVQLHKKISNLTAAPIFIDDTPALSILELRTKCRRLKAQHDIQLVVIDYLQLMSGDSGGKASGNREQEIAYISRSLKGLAKELNIPIIALSQLSRAVESRGGDKIPMLSDLRESGSIEQDADMVMFLHRPEYYGITEDSDGLSTKGTGSVIVAKHRNGSLDTIKLRFVGEYTKFCDLEYSDGAFGSGGFGETSFSSTPNGGDFENQGEIRVQSKINNNNSDFDNDKGFDLGRASDREETPF